MNGNGLLRRLGLARTNDTIDYGARYVHRPLGKINVTPSQATGLLRAEGRVLSFGRRAAFAEAKLTDANGKLYASATSTLLVFDR